MEEFNLINVTFEDINDYLEKVINDLKEKNIKPIGVYGLPRGGLVFAIWLSYKLDIPLLSHAASGCIIIDDISDTGRSLYHYRDNRTQFNKYYITTMYYVKDSLVKPDFYYKEKKVRDWVVYPYEK